MTYAGVASVFRALSDETRLEVLSLLADGEKCACVLLQKVRVSQPTLSHHMRILTDSGIVTTRRQGRWTYYSISAAGSARAMELLRQLTAAKEDGREGVG